jgi:hypothetical protein
MVSAAPDVLKSALQDTKFAVPGVLVASLFLGSTNRYTYFVHD